MSKKILFIILPCAALCATACKRAQDKAYEKVINSPEIFARNLDVLGNPASLSPRDKMRADYLCDAFARKNPDAALAAIDARLAGKPSAALYLVREKALLVKGMYPEALASFDSAAKYQKGPELAATIKQRGTLHSMLGRHKEAAADFTKALSLDPSLRTYTMPERAWSYLKLEKYEPAADDMRKFFSDPAAPADYKESQSEDLSCKILADHNFSVPGCHDAAYFQGKPKPSHATISATLVLPQ